MWEYESGAMVLDVYPSWAWMDGWMMSMRNMHLVFLCADDVIGMRGHVCMR
jgi:hypothetical protein